MRVLPTDPRRHTRLVAPGVNTSWAEETGGSRRKHRTHISVALANQLVSYISPRTPGVEPAGEAISFPPRLSAVLGRTSVYIVMKHSAVLCEV